MSDQKIVMYDSDEAAKPEMMLVWRARTGQLCFREDAARYLGCTHQPCKQCGAPAEKDRKLCCDCREKAEEARFLAMPTAPWDGKATLYSETREEYFNDLGYVEDSLDDGETLSGLRIVICKPVYARKLDEDYFFDEIGDDGELPDHIVEAIEAFNQSIDGTILSWEPGKTRL